MRKTTVIRTLVGSLIALVAGLVLLGCAILKASYDLGPVASGVGVGLPPGSADVAAVVIAGFGAFAIAAAAVLYLIAWIGALTNSVRLPDSDWFLVVLLTGVLGVGPIGMIAYAAATEPWSVTISVAGRHAGTATTRIGTCPRQ